MFSHAQHDQHDRQSNSIMYKAGVSSTDDDIIKEYIGTTSNEFKDRYRNHQNSFNDAEYEKETELSKYIWDFKRKQRRSEESGRF